MAGTLHNFSVDVRRKILYTLYNLHDKVQPFQLPLMFCPAAHKIDAGSIDRAVSQQISEFHNVATDTVEGRGEEVPQIVGKYL